ncbi:SDR family oxidoreductase [Streptomyces sp. NPDC005538]|uniref:SDR family oxidoreductase n=1 Tax=unclassified Streptomyces TaxID=2593676 RepID=UPI00339E1148
MQGPVAVATGAARTIGAAAAETLAEIAAGVLVHYRGCEAETSAVVERITARAVDTIAVQADLRDEGATERPIDTTPRPLGPGRRGRRQRRSAQPVADGFLAWRDHEQLQALAEQSPFGRLGTADDVTGLIAFPAGEAARWITGQQILVNGGALG